jgi:hypothetical protein
VTAPTKAATTTASTASTALPPFASTFAASTSEKGSPTT